MPFSSRCLLLQFRSTRYRFVFSKQYYDDMESSCYPVIISFHYITISRDITRGVQYVYLLKFVLWAEQIVEPIVVQLWISCRGVSHDIAFQVWKYSWWLLNTFVLVNQVIFYLFSRVSTLWSSKKREAQRKMSCSKTIYLGKGPTVCSIKPYDDKQTGLDSQLSCTLMFIWYNKRENDVAETTKGFSLFPVYRRTARRCKNY